MAWIRLDDQIPRHHKMLRAGPTACWFWFCAIAHAQSQLTDGFISHTALEIIAVTTRIATNPYRVARRKEGVTEDQKAWRKLVRILLRVALFDKVKGGIVVHDYLDYNLSRTDVLKRRKEDAERKRRAQSERAEIPAVPPPPSARRPRGIRTEAKRKPKA